MISEPGALSGEGKEEWDNQNGNFPNNANHLCLSSWAPTNVMVVALKYLKEPAWLLTIINLFFK